MKTKLTLLAASLLTFAGVVAVGMTAPQSSAVPLMGPAPGFCQWIPSVWKARFGCPPNAPTPTPTARRTPRPTATGTPISVATVRALTPTSTATRTPTATPTVTPSPLPQPVPLAAQMIQMVNQMRREKGLRELRVDLNLVKAAQDYAKLMAETPWWGHDGPDGSNTADRASAAGYQNWEWVGENLVAQTFGNADAGMQWLSRSRGHYLNMLQPEWQDIGVGWYEKAGSPLNDYFVQVFACSFGNCIPFGPILPTPTFAP